MKRTHNFSWIVDEICTHKFDGNVNTKESFPIWNFFLFPSQAFVFTNFNKIDNTWQSYKKLYKNVTSFGEQITIFSSPNKTTTRHDDGDTEYNKILKHLQTLCVGCRNCEKFIESWQGRGSVKKTKKMGKSIKNTISFRWANFSPFRLLLTLPTVVMWKFSCCFVLSWVQLFCATHTRMCESGKFSISI